MKKAVGFLLPAALAVGCATALTTEGARVKVYGWNGPTTAAANLEGCRLIQTTAPFTEQESERAVSDPYRKERNDVADKGGNVLLVFSQRMIQRPSTDCPPNDKSPGCLETSQTWYRTSFGYYACASDAAARLDAEASAVGTPGPLFSFKFAKKSKPEPATAPSGAASAPAAPASGPSPAAAAPAPSAPASAPAAPILSGAADMEAKIVAMMHEGVSVDVILAWVSTQKSRPALSAEDVIAWKKAGIDERVILAVLGR
ncbi:MAG TPA: hypothetical protein VIA45_14885 [Thermoanaerobaculia bacterium]